ncbi:MAG: glutathione S-transferase family protein [Rhodothalassiaceae bacterium]
MQDAILFYTHPRSRGRIVRWMLEECGVPYRTEIVEYGPAMKEPAYLAINPMGKVPALVAAGRIVTETAAICAFLADYCPEAGLAPKPAERADYYRWLFFAAGPLEQAIILKALGVRPSDEQRGFVGTTDIDRLADILDEALADRDHIAGDAFSAADVYFGSQIGFGLQFGSLPSRPNIAAYWARLADRPARLRAAAIDDALIKDASPAS